MKFFSLFFNVAFFIFWGSQTIIASQQFSEEQHSNTTMPHLIARHQETIAIIIDHVANNNTTLKTLEKKMRSLEQKIEDEKIDRVAQAYSECVWTFFAAQSCFQQKDPLLKAAIGTAVATPIILHHEIKRQKCSRNIADLQAQVKSLNEKIKSLKTK